MPNSHPPPTAAGGRGYNPNKIFATENIASRYVNHCQTKSLQTNSKIQQNY